MFGQTATIRGVRRNCSLGAAPKPLPCCGHTESCWLPRSAPSNCLHRTSAEVPRQRNCNFHITNRDWGNVQGSRSRDARNNDSDLMQGPGLGKDIPAHIPHDCLIRHAIAWCFCKTPHSSSDVGWLRLCIALLHTTGSQSKSFANLHELLLRARVQGNKTS